MINLLAKLMLFIVNIVCLTILLSVNAYAARTINSATVDGGTSVSVSPATSIRADIQVSTTGNGANGRWRSSSWEIDGTPYCVNHTDYSSSGGTFSEHFNIVAPLTSGTYAVTFVAYRNNSCSQGASSDYVLNDAVTVSAPVSGPAVLAEYHLDECDLLDGVIDASGNGYSGTAQGDVETSDQAGKLCRGVELNDDNYLQVTDFPNQTDSFTITAWFNTDDRSKSGQRIFADDENNSGGYAVSVGDGGSGRVRFYHRNQPSSGIIDTDAVIANNTWYFVAAVTDVSAGQRHLYIYSAAGTELDHKSMNISGSLGVDTGAVSIGGETVNGETANRFDGLLDEVVIFDGAMSQNQIETIQQHNIDDENWDGTLRTCPSCSFCFYDDFGRSSLGNSWTIIKEDNFTPQISDGKMMLTDTTGSVASGVTLNGAFPAADNYVEIEFTHYAYGGSGADGIVLVLSDASVSPVAGAYGGSLGYANRSGLAGFSGGWLGFGIDEFGNYSNPTEGRNGGPGFRADAVAVRGHGDTASDYVYITGTGTLSPGIDDKSSSAAAPGYTYRFSIDTRNSKTLIKVERDAGSGDVTLIDWYDATQAAAAPENFRLSITGSTGGSTNYHSIDDFMISATQCGTLGGGVDHYRIEHNATGITCQASTVTLRACVNDDCSVEYAEPTTVTLIPASNAPPNWIGGDTRTFTGNSDVLLQQTTPLILDLGLTATFPAATNVTRCYKDGVEADCAIAFSDTGIFIDGDSDAGSSDSAIETQIAGKPSNVAPNDTVFQVRVLRTDDSSGACVASLVNNSNALFSYLVPEADNGLADNSITLTSNLASETLDGVGSAEELQLAFNADGAAAFWLTSVDAGRYQLQVELDILVTDSAGNPLTDDAGNPTGETFKVSDTSNAFVVRPFAVFADAVGNATAQDGSGGVYKKTGEDFSLDFKSLSWTAGRDADNDGQWDDCGSSTLAAPGAGYARVSQWVLGQPAVSLEKPTGGDSGSISYGNGNITITTGATSVSADNVDYNQVGIIQLVQNGINGFLGKNVAVCSPYIGRFYPDHFDLTQGVLINRSDNSCPSASSFTYLDENLQLSYTLTAKNSSNATTTNYVSSFAKFDGSAGTYTVGAVDDPAGIPTALSSRLDIDSSTQVTGWTAGEAGFNIKLNVDRLTAPDGPFSESRFGVDLHDSDGVGFNGFDLDTDSDGISDHVQATSSGSLRYGRLRLENAHGSEMLVLPMLMQAEYWNGSAFSWNVVDSCSSFSTDKLTLDSVEQSSIVGDNPIRVKGVVTTTATITNQPLSSGDGDLEFSAPGVGGVGWVDVQLTVPHYLQFDWHGSGDSNPTSRATFGVYQGNEHIIYIRETTWR